MGGGDGPLRQISELAFDYCLWLSLVSLPLSIAAVHILCNYIEDVQSISFVLALHDRELFAAQERGFPEHCDHPAREYDLITP